MTDDQPHLARHGWRSDFPAFAGTPPRVIRASLQKLIQDASIQQIRAWDTSIPQLQREVREVVEQEYGAREYNAILEYELPMEARRPDVVLLVRGAVVVLELKGKSEPSIADIDQAAAYARDLRCYHRDCENYPVHAVVVPTRARGYVGVRSGVHVAGPESLDSLVQQLQPSWPATPLDPVSFLAADAYRPLPTLVRAARELFETGNLRTIRRARAATDPAVGEISRIIHEAARTRSRRLVLLTGVPGTGKTLVGLRVVHAHFLDDLTVSRSGGRPSVPAVFLSGNGPLVEVLQYELRAAGGGGKAFVRNVRDYVRQYSRRPSLIPPEHVLIFDEAQRAWDSDYFAQHHDVAGLSEPEHFVEFSMRVPDWCVILGLIGSGQEIHVGEEAGLVQWRHAIERCVHPALWTVHGAPAVLEVFGGSPLSVEAHGALSLDQEIRYHVATDLHEYVELLLTGKAPERCRELATCLERDQFHLRMSRDLDTARGYLRERYGENPDARFGLLASSKDKSLTDLGIPNDYQSTKKVRYGPWYGDAEHGPRSCRHLTDVITEFGAQGLELDATLLAWGADFIRESGRWTNRMARGYKRGARVRDAFQLRVNAYRVLLTRGRDAVVVFVPRLPDLEETADYLLAAGFTSLDDPACRT